MRLFCLSIILLIVEAIGFAQFTEQQAVQTLNSLVGIWITEGTPEQAAETLEFHWQTGRKKTLLVRRHWMGNAGGSPWKATRDVMLAYYDLASNGIQADLINAEESKHYQLDSAGAGLVRFSSFNKQGLPVYRLTYDVSRPNTLFLRLEQATFNQVNQAYTFVETASLRFHRDHF